MSIASEITALNTNLTAAKNAVTAKGGTVGDTGLAGLAAEIQTIPNSGGSSEPSNGGHITGYDNTTGVITGDGFGATAGTVYLLDRDTNSYVAQPTSSWSDTSITLTNTIDTSSIEGTTSLSVVDSKGQWATKWLITGGIAVAGWGELYIQDPDSGNVSTITMTSQTEFNKLATSTSSGQGNVARRMSIEGVVFYLDELVGMQFGSDFSATSIGNNFLYNANNINQPIVVPNSVTSLGDHFMYACVNFNSPVVLTSQITSIGTNFVGYCTSYNQPFVSLGSITQVKNSFLANSSSFNQSLEIPNGVTSIGDFFLNQCNAFNSEITLPSTLVSIGNWFISGGFSNYYAYPMAFNRTLDRPSSLRTIGDKFLSSCISYNCPITIPEGVTSIGSDFLSCRSSSSDTSGLLSTFNNKITLPSTLTSIGDHFLYYCRLFNKPIVIPNSITSIPDYFMAQCSCFNSDITLPNSLISIGVMFLSNAAAFNKSISLPLSLTSIGTNFMASCQAFNKQLTIPSSVSSVGGQFLYGCYSFSSLVANTSSSPNDNYSLSIAIQYPSPTKCYNKGVTITGSGATAWKAALPDRISSPYRKLIDGTI